MRARELGIAVGTGEPGPRNAITDVAGVRVGHTTLVEGEDIRTGITVVVPPEEAFAGSHRLNGNGEVTGLEWIRESGLLTTPIVNHPEVGILSIGRVAERPVVRNGEIVARPTGTIAVTFDHRVVDGARAAEFGLAVIRYLERGVEPEPGGPQSPPGS